MDHPCHEVTATIIDLGLARMSARNGNDTSVHWTPFDDLTFEGEGEENLSCDINAIEQSIRR
jgi:serine/threonine-protein kinase haspin